MRFHQLYIDKGVCLHLLGGMQLVPQCQSATFKSFDKPDLKLSTKVKTVTIFR
jgi:hypothetical protein